MTDRLTDVLETLSGSVHYQAWIYHHLQDGLGRSILDIGSGLGDLPQLFGVNANRTIVVSNADEPLVERLRRRYAGCPNYRVIRLRLGEADAPDVLAPEAVDTITCVNVLEHIRHDRTALRQMHRMLAPGGMLLLMVPALPCLFGPADQAVGHYRRYTAPHVNRKLRQTGFVVERQRYMNFFGMFTWWLGGALFGAGMFDAHACGLLDQLVPWLERLERLWTPPVGQSLVTICRKM